MTAITPTATTVSDFLLHESRERGEILTNLKLQKLLFYSDAWYLALKKKELFPDLFEAWVHGPVLVSQYHRFSHFKWRFIDEEVVRPKFKKGVEAHLMDIIDVFGSETAVALELMTHREKPWIEARGNLSLTDNCTNKISKKTTGKFYRGM